MTENKLRLATCECAQLCLTVSGAAVHVHGCTCTKCQRSSGSVMSLSAWFPQDCVSIAGRYTTYHFTGTCDPSLMAGFCPICGGGKFFRTGAYLQDCIGIAAGNFADPDFPVPTHIHWWPDRPRWLAPPCGPDLLPGN